MRCFKYLLEKRAFLDSALLNDSFISLPTFGMFDLPTFTPTSTSHPADRPPAYLTVVNEVKCDFLVSEREKGKEGRERRRERRGEERREKRRERRREGSVEREKTGEKEEGEG